MRMQSCDEKFYGVHSSRNGVDIARSCQSAGINGQGFPRRTYTRDHMVTNRVLHITGRRRVPETGDGDAMASESVIDLHPILLGVAA